MTLRAALLVFAACAGCRPSTIAEAEARGDVRWLDENGSPDAIAALGRMADTDTRAMSALVARSSFDAGAFGAAWAAVVRRIPWGTVVLKDGLADPKRADLAASAMQKGDPRLVAFLADLEGALIRLSASPQNLNVATALASIGPPAHESLIRRLVDASTRNAMCRGIASPAADADARKALLAVPEGARDAPSCVDAVVHVAAEDESVLTWLAVQGEPGLLGAAGGSPALSCARLHVAWTKALAARPAEAYPALTVPLGYAVKRCSAEMDGVLADAIVRLPNTRSVVVEAVDPFATYGGALQATCAVLPSVASSGHDSAIVRERASDALLHACKVTSAP